MTRRAQADDGFKTKYQAEFVTPKGGDMALYADLLGEDRANIIEIKVPRKPTPTLKRHRTLTKD